MDYLHIIQNCLEFLLTHLEPVILSTMSQIYGNDYLLYIEYGPKAANLTLSEMRDFFDMNNSLNLRKYKDILFYLNSIIKNWDTFKGLFQSNYVLCLCHSIKHFRNKWAHQSKFTKRELHRFIDECEVLLEEFKLKSEQIDLLRKNVLDAYYKEEVMNYSQLPEENVSHQSKNEINYLQRNDGSNLVNRNDRSSFNNVSGEIKQDSRQKYVGYYNDYSYPHSYCNNDHVMAEGCEGLTESLLDDNYFRVINDKDKNYKDYKIYLYDQEKEERGNSYKN